VVTEKKEEQQEEAQGSEQQQHFAVKFSIAALRKVTFEEVGPPVPGQSGLWRSGPPRLPLLRMARCLCSHAQQRSPVLPGRSM
jgi:hypothetical protein